MAETVDNLKRWHSGDRNGLERLLKQHLSWIRTRVQKRLGSFLRQKVETGDVVQDAMLQFLQHGPRLILSDDEQFRFLLARIVENVICDKYDWFTAKRRQVAKERPLPADTILHLDIQGRSVSTPSRVAHRKEQEALIRLAIELLKPQEREILVLREWEKLSFPKIGQRLGITEEAAQKRFNRSLGGLSDKVGALRRGRLSEAIGEESYREPNHE